MIKNFFINNPIHKKVVPTFDMFFLVNPTFYFFIWVLVAIGMYLPLFINNDIIIFDTSFSIDTFLLYFAITLLSSSLLLINHSKRDLKAYYHKDKFSIAYIQKMDLSLIIFAIAILIYINIIIAVICLIIYLFGRKLFYNNDTSNPIAIYKLLYVAFSMLLLIHIGIIYQINNNLNLNEFLNFKLCFAILPYLLSFLAIMINFTLVKDDNFSNFKIYTFNWKNKIISFSTLFLISIGLVLALNNKDPLASTAIIVYISFFIYAFVRGLDKDLIRSVTYSISILNFFIITLYPYLFIGVFILFYLSKYYYWHRFNIHFPTFLVKND